MDEATLLEALDGEMPVDTAVGDDATEDSGLDAILAELDPSLADDTAPDEGEAEDDGQTAQADDDADGDDEDEDALKRELHELRQAKREAETRAAQAEAEAFWQRDRAQVDTKLRQALDYLDTRLDSASDPTEVVREYVPRLIAGYSQDLAAHFAKREAAWERIARQHGAQTYVQKLQRDYALSEADVAEISQFSPEEMERAARLIAKTRGPIKHELTTTKGKLTKAERAVHAQRLKQQVAPGIGRAGPVSMADALSRITEDKADAQLGPILRLVGVA